MFATIFLQQGFADMRDDFFRALEQKDIKRMKILLDKGFDINTQNNQKQNPILLATYANDIELVQFLYDNGADVNARDRNLDLPELGYSNSVPDRNSPSCAFLSRCSCRRDSCSCSVEYFRLSETHFVRCVL